jgi:hypothetical protein
MGVKCGCQEGGCVGLSQSTELLLGAVCQSEQAQKSFLCLVYPSTSCLASACFPGRPGKPFVFSLLA